MIERRPFCELPIEELHWLKARHHLSEFKGDGVGRGFWGCIRALDDEEIAPGTGFALQPNSNVEIVTYVREGTLTHRDNFGNEGRVEVGNVQVVSAGAGIKHAEYNLEQSPASALRIWLEPDTIGGSPAWGAQPCPNAPGAGCFVAIASGRSGDQDALPIRARARILNAKLKSGHTAEYVLGPPRLAYLIPSSGLVEVNGVRIRERDGAAISDVPVVIITAVEDADILMVDLLSRDAQTQI